MKRGHGVDLEGRSAQRMDTKEAAEVISQVLQCNTLVGIQKEAISIHPRCGTVWARSQQFSVPGRFYGNVVRLDAVKRYLSLDHSLHILLQGQYC